MEKIGVLQVFLRSMVRRGLRYVSYLGDGDSKGHEEVVKSKPYGSNLAVEKLECINHVIKRMKRRLLKMKTTGNKTLTIGNKKVRLFGAKGISDKVIQKLSSYYSKAIRDNPNDINKMRKAVWSTYLHHSDPDKKSNHKFCPAISWCFQKNKQIQRKDLCPPQCIKELHSIYQDLGDDELLKRCLPGYTQNVNEGFNALIWQRLPKYRFGGIKQLKIALYDAVICFNDENVSRKNVLDYFGFEAGTNFISSLLKLDQIKERRNLLI
jgi:hypothetical protein